MKNKMIFLLGALMLIGAACQPATVSQATEEATIQDKIEQPAKSALAEDPTRTLTYPIVDSSQGKCYSDNAEITCPYESEDYFGQDAQYSGLQPSYSVNNDGTVADNITGLTWQQSPDLDGNGEIKAEDKLTLANALQYCENLELGGFDDWRLPDIKTLYSLILFSGTDPSSASGTASLIPFIENTYFDFAYGDTAAGERTIDSQYASSTIYVGTTMGGLQTDFGVNFADGRIKGYGLAEGAREKTFFVQCVRGNPEYGINSYMDNNDGSITDQATGLTWQQADSGEGMTWQSALDYCNGLSLAGNDDWRLPNAKELQSIVDYSRSPDTSDSAAINPLFFASAISNEAGQKDYPFYWSSTTHASSDGRLVNGAYVAFGRALGYMNDTWMDVHGAGAQRSDPKSGDPGQYPTGHGPQGDAIRINNYVRCVRGGEVSLTPEGLSQPPRTGMSVEVSGNEQQASGTNPGQGGQAVPPGQGSPPSEALSACQGSSAGSACQFQTPKGTVNGTCQLIQNELACVP